MKFLKLALVTLFTAVQVNAATSTTAGNVNQTAPPQADMIGGKDGSGNLQVPKVTGGNLSVDASGSSSLPLPSGAATSALQVIENGLAQSALSQLQAGLAVSSSALPAGAATSALQSTINTTLGTLMLNSTGLSLSSNQLSGGQKSQIVDGSNATVGPVVGISGINYLPVIQASIGTSGSAVPARSSVVAGSDGVNARTLATDTSGKLNINASTANITQVGGIALTAGQSIAANSVPVVLASNQPSVGTLTNDGAGNGISSQTSPLQTSQRYLNGAVIGDDPPVVINAVSVLSGDVYPALDVSGYAGLSVQLTGAFTATISFQGSNDNFTTASAVFCWNTGTINAIAVSTAAAASTFWCPRVYKYFRVRATAYTSGTITGNTQAMVFVPNDVFAKDILVTSGTLTTVTTVTTVSTDNLAANTATTDLASTAKTTTFTQATVTPASGQLSESIQIAVTVVSGTNPTMDCVVAESYDSGTNFQVLYSFERITATGFYTTPMLRVNGNRVNYTCTIGGTTPSFTMSIVRVGSQASTQIQRRYFDRTINPQSNGSTSIAFNIEDCAEFSYGVADTTAGTPGTFDLQLSEDNIVYEKQGINITPASNASASINNIPLLSKWAQIVVTNAGVTETLNYAWLHCVGN